VRAVHLVASLAALAGGLAAGDAFTLEAPGANTRLGPGGVLYVAGSGFVWRKADWLVSGEALRLDQANDDLWAEGHVILVMPRIRLHVAKVGLHPERKSGEAWGVEAWIDAARPDAGRPDAAGPDAALPARQMRIRAERVELADDRLSFHGVEADLGHGGAARLHCPILRIWLREEQRTDKSPDRIARYVEGVAATRPYVTMAGVPVLWLPYLYRDYIIDYPWTHVEGGQNTRQGWWIRYRIGSNLPEAAGWRTRLVGRVERNARAGNGYGLEAYWKHKRLGRGSATWVELPKERVADPADEEQEGGVRRASAYDLEHHAAGERWSAAARWTRTPDADPSSTLPDGRSPDERFRADFLAQDLGQKPFARRGGVLTWRLPGMAVTVDAERRTNRDIDETERWLGLEAVLPRLVLAGPVGIEGSARIEDLHQQVRETEARRTTWDGKAVAAWWLGGVGFSAEAGGKGVRYDDGRFGGTVLDPVIERRLPYTNAAVRLRTAAHWDDVQSTIEPRLGLQVVGRGEGDDRAPFDFLDGRDAPEEDVRFLVTGCDASVAGPQRGFTLGVQARWGLRQVDRELLLPGGELAESRTALADVSASASGRPHPRLSLDLASVWDARPERWTSFDSNVRWRVHDRVRLTYDGSLVSGAVQEGYRIQHKPGVEVSANRYRLDAWVQAIPDGPDSPGGRAIDIYGVQVHRRMVDGHLTFGYEIIYGDDSHVSDRRISLGFSLFTDRSGEPEGGSSQSWALR
jgi:hypothetical protein